ncbi:metal ABC transporter solute-binding protein, Zn/Mn family [Microbacterium sp. NC79]|uniref:metal ABC transporter substrate-binding protein n=1 Tax=Microbacterium sp. NC79 TaxID=2851009 RepID=UPI001C2C2641|nr:zinc ABC transporter substrate-binding protein [Microbacterium sp. NC79]MBV0893718.1 zinc ABC transporter substrate-binding protein [Microbacterium sp. NC79]
MHRSLALSLLAVTAITLAGCSSTPAAEDGRLQVVATTSVYGSIVEEIGGEHVVVTSLISSAAQDPHEYEPSSKDKLIVNRADLVVSNGGGYDAFVGGLITKAELPVIEAVSFAPDYPGQSAHDDHAHDDEHAHDDHQHDEAAAHDDSTADEHEGHDHIAGFNEHVWYDPAVVAGLAAEVAERLSALDPDNAADYEQNALALGADLDGLSEEIKALAAAQDHTHILVTEPVALRLTDLLGMHNVTPAAFLEAVEEGQDVAPATLLHTLQVLEDDDIALVVANAQTGGNETERIIDDAEKAGIAVLEFSEVLPDGHTYVTWMSENIAALARALEPVS